MRLLEGERLEILFLHGKSKTTTIDVSERFSINLLVSVLYRIYFVTHCIGNFRVVKLLVSNISCLGKTECVSYLGQWKWES